MIDDNMTAEKADAEIEKTRLQDEREAAMPPPIKPAAESDALRARIEDFSFYYANGFQAIKSVSMPILDRKVTAIIGPSGCGKSTIWRVLQKALGKLGQRIPTYVMNPKSMPREQLLGHMDMDTREWFDGVLTSSARKVNYYILP